MSHRLRGLAAAVAGLAVIASAVGAAPASARPKVKIGAPGTPVLSVTKSAAAFDVSAHWTAGANATSYQLKLANASGATLDSGSVTTTSWTGHVSSGDGTTVTVTVTAMNGTRKGPSKSASTTLPDVTKPVASYQIVRNEANPTDGEVTVLRTSLSDNLSPNAAITQTVDWGNGAGPQAWPTSQSEITFVYDAAKAVHYLTVTVADESGNAESYLLTAVVNDTQAPSGVFTVSSASAWAAWTKLTLSQASATDDLSLSDKLSRVVDWGDGTAPAIWAQGAVATHVYKVAGAFTPKVTLIDEAGNDSDPIATAPVTVTVDKVAPKVRLTLPKTRKAYVRSWTTLRGTATDAGTGVRYVKIRVTQKRATGWFSYRPGTRTWVKGGPTLAKAYARSGVVRVRTTANHAWALRVTRLARGTLVYKAAGVDNRYNASTWVQHRQLLTRR